MLRLVIFDLDGTLLDTLEDLRDAVNFALRAEALPTRSLAEVRAFVGNGIRKLIERAVPAGTPPEQIDRTHARFTEYYRAHCEDHTAPYPGVRESMRRLRDAGLKTAIVSNKADYAVQKLCETWFGGLCDLAVGERTGMRKKPAPDMTEYALSALGVQGAEAVYVGDSDVDLETAKNAGLRAVSVLWGFRDRDFLEAHGATCFAADADEMTEKILGQF